MYSRYSGYRPFVPLNNTLSRNVEDDAPQPPFEPEPVEQAQIPFTPEPAAIPAAAAAAAALPQSKGLLESLFGLGGGNRRRGGRGGGVLDFGGDALGGIANLLRSGGGGIGKLLQGFSINWDSGDILLALILLFLSLESDDDEILILLGLMLVMGF